MATEADIATASSVIGCLTIDNYYSEDGLIRNSIYAIEIFFLLISEEN